MKYPKTDLDFARYIIEFDPRNRSTYAEWTEIEPILQERAKEVPWPYHLAPKPKPYSENPDSSDPLPEAEYLVVTWTTAENHALADILTPGYSKTSWYNYDRFFESNYKRNIQQGAPSLEENRLGSFFPISIGQRMQLLRKTLDRLVSDEKIITIVKQSYKVGITVVRDLITEIKSSCKNYIYGCSA